MNKRLLILRPILLALGAAGSVASAQDTLVGEARMACEAILCLSTGAPPVACTPALTRYFDITRRRLSDTLRARLDFLRLCPISDQTPEMRSLVSSIASGAGRCDASSLNRSLRTWGRRGDDAYLYIRNQMPGYCLAYGGNPSTDFSGTGGLPRYVGTPDRGGHWVEAGDFERALAQYQERIRREDGQLCEVPWLGCPPSAGRTHAPAH